MNFSDRIGAARRVIQKDSMDEGLRNALWNAAYGRYWNYYADKQQHATYIKEGQLLFALWTEHSARERMSFPSSSPPHYEQLSASLSQRVGIGV